MAKEHARRVTIEVNAYLEWHEEDFGGDLEALKAHKPSDDDVREMFMRMYPTTDEIINWEGFVVWEDIVYEEE